MLSRLLLRVANSVAKLSPAPINVKLVTSKVSNGLIMPPCDSRNPTFERGTHGNELIRHRLYGCGDDPVFQALVMALAVMLSYVFGNGTPQRPLPNEDRPIQEFVFDRAYESLGIGIQIRRLWRHPDDLGSTVSNRPTKLLGRL